MLYPCARDEEYVGLLGFNWFERLSIDALVAPVPPLPFVPDPLDPFDPDPPPFDPPPLPLPMVSSGYILPQSQSVDKFDNGIAECSLHACSHVDLPDLLY